MEAGRLEPPLARMAQAVDGDRDPHHGGDDDHHRREGVGDQGDPERGRPGAHLGRDDAVRRHRRHQQEGGHEMQAGAEQGGTDRPCG